MSLRRLPLPAHNEVDAASAPTQSSSLTQKGWQKGAFRFLGNMSMRGRLAMLTAIVVISSIAIITLASYSTVRAVMYQDVDRALKVQAQAIVDGSSSLSDAALEEAASPDHAPRFVEDSSNLKVMVIPAGETGSSVDDATFEGQLGPAAIAVVRGERAFAFETFNGDRMYVMRDNVGRVVVVAQSTTSTQGTLDSLAIVLFLLAITGAIGALITGIAVASAGVQPIERLRNAVERVTATGELRQIPVHTRDELGDLTVSYNGMMSALQSAETKQKDLVADASHELKTPLTSLRTNVELLMQVSEPDSQKIDKAEVEALQRDVIGQINEMSSLIGDLLNLAREDSAEAHDPREPVCLEEVFESVLERVQRRRSDVKFSMRLVPWKLEGDKFSLTRALMNLLDNAAKWSPEDGVVRVWMDVIEEPTFDAQGTVEIRIADSGPGIPEEERPKIFDRFYRSIQARSMPGSGLGLAIVKQNIEKHNGMVIVDESDDGGTLMRILLPGIPIECEDFTQVSP